MISRRAVFGVAAGAAAVAAIPNPAMPQGRDQTLLAASRAVDPPIWVLDDDVLSAIRTYPGGLTVLDVGSPRA